ncbi:hypothetical protein Poli38472_005727 [Pythium oligandrum]|uniref:Uncharacterized protein n=1 Tax=Pythium oligandrum TaxID=41045 RepID=A0A8K1CRH9_PYTOL|nr:hypothetical protein Poli38472_005727 [Pythium oligandrum]|eukprot:TMW68259.1 hypothetical protein Poli38472_005727 [Pythium oligandrum]
MAEGYSDEEFDDVEYAAEFEDDEQEEKPEADARDTANDEPVHRPKVDDADTVEMTSYEDAEHYDGDFDESVVIEADASDKDQKETEPVVAIENEPLQVANDVYESLSSLDKPPDDTETETKELEPEPVAPADTRTEQLVPEPVIPQVVVPRSVEEPTFRSPAMVKMPLLQRIGSLPRRATYGEVEVDPHPISFALKLRSSSVPLIDVPSDPDAPLLVRQSRSPRRRPATVARLSSVGELTPAELDEEELSESPGKELLEEAARVVAASSASESTDDTGAVRTRPFFPRLPSVSEAEPVLIFDEAATIRLAEGDEGDEEEEQEEEKEENPTTERLGKEEAIVGTDQRGKEGEESEEEELDSEALTAIQAIHEAAGKLCEEALEEEGEMDEEDSEDPDDAIYVSDPVPITPIHVDEVDDEPTAEPPHPAPDPVGNALKGKDAIEEEEEAVYEEEEEVPDAVHIEREVASEHETESLLHEAQLLLQAQDQPMPYDDDDAFMDDDFDEDNEREVAYDEQHDTDDIENYPADQKLDVSRPLETPIRVNASSDADQDTNAATVTRGASTGTTAGGTAEADEHASAKPTKSAQEATPKPLVTPGRVRKAATERPIAAAQPKRMTRPLPQERSTRAASQPTPPASTPKAPVPRQVRPVRTPSQQSEQPLAQPLTQRQPRATSPTPRAASFPPVEKPMTAPSPTKTRSQSPIKSTAGSPPPSPSAWPLPRKAPVYKQKKPSKTSESDNKKRLKPVKCPPTLRIELPHVDKEKREWLMLNMFRYGDDTTKYEPFIPQYVPTGSSPPMATTSHISEHVVVISEDATLPKRPLSARQIYGEGPQTVGFRESFTTKIYSRRGRKLVQHVVNPVHQARERNWVGTKPNDSSIPKYDAILDKFCKTVTSPVVQRQIYETRYDDLSPQLAMVLEKRAFKEWKHGSKDAFGAVSNSYKTQIVPLHGSGSSTTLLQPKPPSAT